MLYLLEALDSEVKAQWRDHGLDFAGGCDSRLEWGWVQTSGGTVCPLPPVVSSHHAPLTFLAACP